MNGFSKTRKNSARKRWPRRGKAGSATRNLHPQNIRERDGRGENHEGFEQRQLSNKWCSTAKAAIQWFWVVSAGRHAAKSSHEKHEQRGGEGEVFPESVVKYSTSQRRRRARARPETAALSGTVFPVGQVQISDQKACTRTVRTPLVC